MILVLNPENHWSCRTLPAILAKDEAIRWAQMMTEGEVYYPEGQNPDYRRFKEYTGGKEMKQHMETLLSLSLKREKTDEK